MKITEKGMIVLVVVLSMVSSYAEAYPVRGRVFGMYYMTTDRTPQFPFRALWQVNPNATRGSGSDATPATDLLDPADVASLPADAFTRTGYPDTQDKSAVHVFTISNLTANADYLLEFYINEPYYTEDGKRSQYVSINGSKAKTSEGVEDLVVSPFALGGNRKASVGKIAFTNVTAMADGSITFSFPINIDHPVLNVATLSGTNMPTAAALTLADDVLHWSASRDALAYYVERSMDGVNWTPLAALDSSARSFPASHEAGVRTEYRVVSSNGLGTVASNIAVYMPTRRVRYALNIGAASVPCGWFMPADGALVSPCWARSLADSQAVLGLDQQYGKLDVLYRTYAHQLAGGDRVSLAFSNLTANAEYEVRLHSIETWNEAVSEERSRRATILANGESVGEWRITEASGYVPFTAIFTNITVCADANGSMEVGLCTNKWSDSAVVLCGVEVFARGDEPMSADVPDVRVVGFSDAIRVVPETRHAQFTYEIEYKDSEDGEAATLATDASAYGLLDRTVTPGATRWYRARGKFLGSIGSWSAWVAGTCAGRGVFDALRVNFTKDWAGETPSGWQSDETFRVSPSAVNLKDSDKPFPAVEQGAIPCQAPDVVYQTQICRQNNTTYNYRHAFPGFDPCQTYLVRLHLFESYYTEKGNRKFDVALRNMVFDSFRDIDMFALCGGTRRPGVIEIEVRSGVDGVIAMTTISKVENAVLRGIEFLPAKQAAFGSGRLAVMRDASDSTPGNTNETVVSERDMSSLSWTAADAEGVENPRFLAHARFYAPGDGEYTFSTTANGTFNLWVDDQPVPTDSPVTFSAGVHSLYVEHMPSGAVASELSWSACGMAPSALSPYLVSAQEKLSYPNDWHFIQIGQAQSPAFLHGTSAEGTNFLMGASGDGMWDKDDCATFLYHAAGKSAFECSFRVTALDGPVLSYLTRFGIAVRSSLSSADPDGFLFYGGVDGTRHGTIRGYGDLTPGDGNFVIDDAFPEESFDDLVSPPFRLKMARERNGATDRYVLSYLLDDGTCLKAVTQNIAHVNGVYVGPCSISHSSAGSSLVHYGFEDLVFSDFGSGGLIIIVK